MGEGFSYDRLAYPSMLHPQTHPDRLATLATLFGMTPPDPGTSRVLDVGCGDGGTLIPFATCLPEATFVGIDLASSAIERGKALVAELGLTNVTLLHGDLVALGGSLPTFDYILAHGFYSWVPAPAREALLELCRSRLTPRGVAFVSYAAYPGSHLKDAVRGMMRFHTRGLAEPLERERQAKALLGFLAGGVAPAPGLPVSAAGHYRAFLQSELADLPAHVLFHDELSEIHEAVYFHEFEAHARRHGLQYLAEAELFEMQTGFFPKETADALAALAGNVVALEQYLDFLKFRRFRQTLLVHEDVRLTRALDPGRMTAFRFSSEAAPASASPDVAPGVPEEFQGRWGAAMRTDHPVAKAAILALHEDSPASLAFEDLLRRVHVLLREERAGDAQALAAVLLSTIRSGLVSAHVLPPAFTLEPGDRPLASPLARREAAIGLDVSTLKPDRIELESPFLRRLLTLLDGTRDREQLARELSGEENGGLSLDAALHTLARHALLR